MQIGEFGKAHFKIRKKGVQFTGIEAYGTIIDMDAKNVLFKDNDGYEFIVSKARFEFEKKHLIKT